MRAWAEREWPAWALRERADHGRNVLFSFSFYFKSDQCLNLCRKFYADPKIVETFV